MEFEPIKKDHYLKNFLKKNAYVLILGVILLLGTSYSLTFFIQNKKIGEITMNVGGLTYTVSDKNISITSMAPKTDSEGILIYDKELTLTNTSALDGKLILNIARTSGAPLNSLRYGLYENGVLIGIDDVPSDGLIYVNSLLGNEVKTIKVALWMKSDYSGSETTFVGTLEPTITLDTTSAAKYISSLPDLTNNYVKFNCNGSTCETWRIKEVSNGRLVLTTDAYLSSTFTDSGLFTNPSGLNDETLVVSMSTDNHAVYLKKTTKIVGGNGTSASPYELASDVDSSYDHKILAYITYMNNSTELTPKQPIYYGQTNYISKRYNNANFLGWSETNGGVLAYNVGDVFTGTNNTTLYSLIAYTVTYRWGHVVLDTQQVAAGTTITLPPKDSFPSSYLQTAIDHIVVDNWTGASVNIATGNYYLNGMWFSDPTLSAAVSTTQTINADTTFYAALDLVDDTSTADADSDNMHYILLFKDSDLTSNNLTYVSSTGHIYYGNVTTNNFFIHGTIGGITGYYFDIGHLGSTTHNMAETEGDIIVQFSQNGTPITYKYMLISNWEPCLLAGTEVTVEVEEEDEDGKKKKKWKKKKIEDITYDDNLVVWDFDHGCFATAKPLWIMETKETDEYYNIKFEDGTELNAVTAHRIFNLDLNKFTYLNDEKLTPIGTRVYKEDGTITRIVERKKVYETSKYHNIVTEYHLNLFANGILTSCRLNNMYEIKDMKFVKDERVLRDRSEFYDIDDKYINGFRLLEQPRDDINRMNAVYHGADLREYVITNFLNHKK